MKFLIRVILLGCVLFNSETLIDAGSISQSTPLADNYWRPTDVVEYQITFSDICETDCFVEGMKVNRTKISDVSTDEIFTPEEMVAGEFSDITYKTKLSYGEDILHEGTLSSLIDSELFFEKAVYFEEGSEMTFNLDIYFDKSAGNEYQSKQYVYEFLPVGYIVEDDIPITPPETGFSSAMIVVGGILISFGLLKRKEET